MAEFCKECVRDGGTVATEVELEGSSRRSYCEHVDNVQDDWSTPRSADVEP